MRVTLCRPDRCNAMTHQLLVQLHAALERAETEGRRLWVLDGEGDQHFCSGMDLEELVSDAAPGGSDDSTPSLYGSLLRRMSLSPCVVVARVKGAVSAGGVGLVAASDLAYATPRATFVLPEVMWGLLPAMVAPYLIRRTGFQPAYAMSLTTEPMSAAKALEVRLLDGVWDDLDRPERSLAARIARSRPATIAELKRYFRRCWIVDDETEDGAAATTSRLAGDAVVRAGILGFVRDRRLPWEAT
jgi:polyketide biosynthesis enoyl-CoA hydratase PksH